MLSDMALDGLFYCIGTYFTFNWRRLDLLMQVHAFGH